MKALWFPPALCQLYRLSCRSLSWRGCRLFGESKGRLEGGDKEREEEEGKGKGGGKSKQSLVNFPEGRPRAWLGRAPGRANQRQLCQPIKRQAPYHLQSTKCACRIKDRKCEWACFTLSEGGYREILTFICILYQWLERLWPPQLLTGISDTNTHTWCNTHTNGLCSCLCFSLHKRT